MMADVTFERPTGDRRVGRLMESVPSELRDSFSDAQREALGAALGTVGNALFMGAVTTVICSVVLIIALICSSILVP